MMHARRARAALSSTLLAAALVLASCLSRTPATQTPGSADADASPTHNFVWPERLGQRSLPDRGHLHLLPTDTRGWVGYRVPLGMAIEGDRETMEALGPLADAIAEEVGHRDVGLSFEQARSYIVVPTDDGDTPTADARYSIFLSARDPVTQDGSGTARIANIQRTWFRLTLPASEPRGLAVVLPGMFGTPEDVVDRLDSLLLERGWASLRMLAPSSRTTERLPISVDSEASINSAARRAAVELDDRNAECAYAVRAAVRDAIETYPSLGGLPRVAIAMSGSAIMLPAVIAWDERDGSEGYDAAVLIAGGCHALRIARESSYADWIDAVRISVDPAMPEDTVRRLEDAYLQHSTLDGYHVAPSISDRPLLMVHASADRAVPAATGDLLWEKLGRPERWTVPVGHELVFASVMLRAPGIVSWLEKAVEAESTAESDAGGN
ncbi:MAG: hypothetical protein AAGB48_02790 [Planctomycetota bacterium]